MKLKPSIQTLRAFRRAKFGGSEDWRLAGMEDWGKGKSGLENGCLGAGKLVPGRPKWVLGSPNWRQNGSSGLNTAQVEPKMPKLDNKIGLVERFGGNLKQLGANLASSWAKNGSSRPSWSNLDAILRHLEAHQAT